ncbi:MAG: carbamate kinase [Thermoplasmata archaeon]
MNFTFRLGGIHITKTAVVAIGGNAILRAGQKGSAEEQFANLNNSMPYLVRLIKDGYDIVITHGNGPQVGNILLQNELAKTQVPPMPLDVCGAMSQGLLGYMIQQTLTNLLAREGLKKCVVSVVTQVVVSKDDPAFKNPTKPVGQYYPEEVAKQLMREKGWVMKEDKARGGFRRVVPSPEPIDIVEKEAIKRLVFAGENQEYVVVAAGGGGIPVIKTDEGYRGVEAVIDKDLASSVLANAIDEKFFIILTDVDRVYLNFRKAEEKAVAHLTLSLAEKYYEEGQFPGGSMGPKVLAAIRFLQRGGEKVLITSGERLRDALEGRTGTVITK